MMWHEDALKHLVHLDPDRVFGDRVQILNLDTKNTLMGRADLVLFDTDRDLIVCELERVLRAKDVNHALIEQAWKYGKYLYWNASYGNLRDLYRNYYRQYLDPKGSIPELHARLGIADGKPEDWKQKVIIWVAAWEVEDSVYELAAQMAKRQADADGDEAFPCQVIIGEIGGQRCGNRGRISLRSSQPRRVFESDRKGQAFSRALVSPTNQHCWSQRLSSCFSEVERLLPAYLPKNSGNSISLLSESKQAADIVKYLPWGLKAYVCFEASTCDLNPRKSCPHFQFYAGKRKDINADISNVLQSKWNEIAVDIGCKVSDLQSQGVGYPIKQYNVEFSNPEAIAEGFGRFISAVRRVVDPYIW